MIKIFRRMRQNLLYENKFRKYLFYAIGEIILVVIGILIALSINNWNEADKSKKKEKDYLNSFYEENKVNESNLTLALDFANTSKNDIDSLKQMLFSKEYNEVSIKNLSASMMALSDFSPSIITMENITASGDFEIISNFKFREHLIDTYNSYETTAQYEAILSDYVNQYVTPFFFENIRFSDFSTLKENIFIQPEFENIVIGYDALLTQELKGYKDNLVKLKKLNQLLSSVNNR